MRMCVGLSAALACAAFALAWMSCPDAYEASGSFAYWPGEIRVNEDGGVVPAGFHVGNHSSPEETVRQCLSFIESDEFGKRVARRHGKMFPESGWTDSKWPFAGAKIRLSVSGSLVPVVSVWVRGGRAEACSEILAAYVEEVASSAWEQEKAWARPKDRGHVPCPVHMLKAPGRGCRSGKLWSAWLGPRVPPSPSLK